MRRFYSLDEQFKLEGTWWVPSQLDLGEKHGTFTFEPGKYANLKLGGFEILSKKSVVGWGGFTEPGHQIIKGLTESGHSVLLLENQTQAFNLFYPRLVLVSDQEITWNQINEIRFSRLAASYTYLEDWGRSFPFTEESEYDDQNDRLTSYSAKYTPPQPIIVPLSSVEAEIQFVPYFEGSLRLTKVELKYQLLVEIVAHEARSVRWLLDQLQHVQDFLALLIGEPIRKLYLIATLDSSESNSGVSQTIHIYHSVPVPAIVKDIAPSSMITAQSLGGSLPQVIDAWFRPDLLELWEVLRDIYFGVLYDALKVPRFQFLALTQVLESYHRRKFGGEYLSEKKYENIKNAIIAAIPASVKRDHRASLKSRLNYGYQYSLRKRFLFLLGLLDDNTQRLLKITRIDKPYLEKIFATRNYYTHYDPADRARAFEGQDLVQANARLAHMIVALFLHEELTIPHDQIVTYLKHRRDVGNLW